MKFGVLYDFRNPPKSEWFTPWPEFYSGAFGHMQEMERLGFNTISLCEHHFQLHHIPIRLEPQNSS